MSGNMFSLPKKNLSVATRVSESTAVCIFSGSCDLPRCLVDEVAAPVYSLSAPIWFDLFFSKLPAFTPNSMVN